MNDDQRRPRPQSGWAAGENGGDYDADATAFVQLPPQPVPGADPLSVSGGGSPVTDPGATGAWSLPFAQQAQQTQHTQQMRQAPPAQQGGQGELPESGPWTAPQQASWPGAQQTGGGTSWP
ncbi:hypothetical protein ACWGNE_01055, partial [Streptomyces xiamenensis]